MTSQLDLDQGGTNREWARVYLGPSVGWVYAPQRNLLFINVAGTYTLDLSTNYVQVNIAGAVTVVLPSVKNVGVVGGVNPSKFVFAPVNIVDIGGFAAANPITIQPAATETIMGLSSIQITSNFGGFTLYPRGAGAWNNQS